MDFGSSSRFSAASGMAFVHTWEHLKETDPVLVLVLNDIKVAHHGTGSGKVVVMNVRLLCQASV